MTGEQKETDMQSLLGSMAGKSGDGSAPTAPWLPIETAPKDGTMILVAEPKNHQRRLVVWNPHWKAWLSVPGRIQVRPTHWTPIPIHPEGRGAER